MSEIRDSRLGWAPAIPSHWQVVPLRYVADMGTGHTPDRNKAEYWEDCTIPWVTTPDVTKRADSFAPLLETEQKISRLGMAKSAAVLHPEDTVMLSRTASIGYSVRIGRPMATTQAFVTWKSGERLDSRYLLMVLRAMKEEWARLAYGSTHLTIYMPDLESIRIPLPPLVEQRRIVDFIDREVKRIDALIAADHNYAKLLKERQESELYAALSGSDVAGCRVDHPMLGSLPSRWPVVKLRRLVPRVGVGVVVDPSSYFSEEGVPFLHGANILAGKIDVRDVRRISDLDSRRLWRSRLEEGDVVVVRAGYPGRAAVITSDLDGANCASIIVLKKGKLLLPSYLAAYFNSPLGKAYVDSVRYGAAQEQINVSHVVDFMVPVPSPSEQVDITRRLDDTFRASTSMGDRIVKRSALLAERRQALITAAVTGQFDVTTARGADV